MNPGEPVSDLYFELSNPDRLKIMLHLRGSSEKLTEIAAKIETTHQQCLRHLKRLAELELIEKEHDGSYSLTSYGELVLQLTPSLAFVTEHRDYFNSHKLTNIPTEFISRIGELSESIKLRAHSSKRDRIHSQAHRRAA